MKLGWKHLDVGSQEDDSATSCYVVCFLLTSAEIPAAFFVLLTPHMQQLGKPR